MTHVFAQSPSHGIYILAMLCSLILGYGVFLPLCTGLWQKLETIEK